MHARKHARARARCRRLLLPPLPAPTSSPLQLERTEEGWMSRGGGHVPPRLHGFFGKNARSSVPSRGPTTGRTSTLRHSLHPGLRAYPAAQSECENPAPSFLFCFVLCPLGPIALSARPPKCEIELTASAVPVTRCTGTLGSGLSGVVQPLTIVSNKDQ